MNPFLILSFSVLSFCNISAANDSIPVERKRASPARRIPSMSNPRDLSPRSDSPFKIPLELERAKSPQPSLQAQEMPYGSTLTTKGRTSEDKLIDPWGFVLTERHINRWYRNISGFRIFVDQGATFGLGKNYNYRVDWYGSFGYQFNPIYYLGIGQGYSLSLNNQESSAPLFVNPRINFLDENTTPFADIKVGYSFIEGKGIYINPNVGVSFGKKRRALNISAGYTFQKANIKKHDVKSSFKYHGASLRLTYEFGVF